jgi:putative hydroxymethylpyrimidine transport system ATP-binding protein
MLSVSGLSKAYNNRIIFAGFGFTVEPGRFAVFIGPSGCGKSTLFDVLTGVTKADSGSISWHNREVAHLGTSAAYMHQKDLLLPWCTLLENGLLPVRAVNGNFHEAMANAEQLFVRLGLAGYKDHLPSQVSGGMRQRCALIRTLMFNRELILLDEPLSALDAITQRSLQSLLLLVQKEFAKTFVMITHDIEEALLLADDLFLLSARPMTILEKFILSAPKPRKFNDPQLLAIREQVLAGLEGDIYHEAS